MTDAIAHFTAGTAAGMAGVLAEYPLDTVKTRMQVSAPVKVPCICSPISVTTAISATAAAPRTTYWQCVSHLYQCGGVRSFYSGLSLPLAAQSAEAAVIFSVYNSSLQHFLRKQQLQPQEQEQGKISTSCGDHTPRLHGLRQDDSKHRQQQQQPQVPVWSSPAHWKASACAGFAVSFVLTPVEMLKCNRQMHSARPHWNHRQATARELARHLLSAHGVSGLYTGMAGTVMRAVLGNMAYFVSYEQCREWLAHGFARSSHDDEVVPMWHSMLAGGISGCCYWTIAYPADVAKTKMQVCPLARQQGFTRTLANVYSSGGAAALYRGWGVTVVRAFLSGSIVFTTHEHCCNYLRRSPSALTHVYDSAVASTPKPPQEPQAALISH
ncbi:hypothetical protein JKF63_05219 [Porcisia hertigi]|uniref:Mitochondrial ornithine transporter 1 n=1 Tax=Porcisia hertigi TaxID=2761500 RepID=A0A836IWC6_9TRYP|nr:hypothetical protein JKF63_05219 [Porcisia hertigi]